MLDCAQKINECKRTAPQHHTRQKRDQPPQITAPASARAVRVSHDAARLRDHIILPCLAHVAAKHEESALKQCAFGCLKHDHLLLASTQHKHHPLSRKSLPQICALNQSPPSKSDFSAPSLPLLSKKGENEGQDENLLKNHKFPFFAIDSHCPTPYNKIKPYFTKEGLL